MTTPDNQFTFLAYRRKQEREHMAMADSVDPLSSILSVEINTTELCNRKCVFCPRHDPKVYPSRNIHMSPFGAGIIASKLTGVYRGKISLSGFGENLLNPVLPEIIAAFRQQLPDNIIECNTNGDWLDRATVDRIFGAGLTFLYINLYDGAHQIERFDRIMQGYEVNRQYRYRMHWDGADHGLVLNNRSGVIQWLGTDETDVASLRGTPCYYPFYKLFIDWNGDALFCSNDWGREHVIGNLMNDSLYDVWFSKPMRSIRRKLARGDRSQSPCDKCSVKGTLFGRESFEIIQDHEKRQADRKIHGIVQATDRGL